MKTFSAHCLLFIVFCFYNVSSACGSDSIVSVNRNNAVYYELAGYGLWLGSLNYERTIPLNPRTGIALRAGMAWYEKFFPVAGIDLLLGSGKRYFETGIGYTAFHEGNLVFLGLGYRYQGNRGFFFRALPIISLNQKFFWLGISFGYSFGN